MSQGNKYASFESFQPVENMNPKLRQQQYAYNGRMFIPPATEKFTLDSNLSNGLIELDKYEGVAPYELYKNSNSKQTTCTNIISNIIVPNSLSRTFFSNDNIEIIQSQIINDVFTQSNKYISKQSYQEIQIIMKSIYLQYSQNLQNHIEEQILRLNKYVVDECVSIIIPNVLQYNKYITEISAPIPVSPRSINVSNKGDNSLPGPPL